MSDLCTTTGWLLDLYASGSANTLWLLCEDGARRPFTHLFPVSCYVAGPAPRLRQLWRFLQTQPQRPTLGRDQRRDLFSGMIDVLTAEVASAAALPPLIRAMVRRFPDLTYYDADIPLTLRYAAQGIFPLVHCTLHHDDLGRVHTITPLQTQWDKSPLLPPLRILTITPDTDPAHTPPTRLHIRSDQRTLTLPLHPPRLLLIQLNALLKRHDPDLILTRFGDTWLFPHLLALAAQPTMPDFNPNRDQRYPPHQRQPNSYFSYGQVIFRGQQVHCLGRDHIDQQNAMLYTDCGLAGVIEQARITGLPLQEVARKSPGAGVTALQMITALRDGILIPYQKQQAEQPKTARQLLQADRGGLVYQPIIGLHRDVVEVDFVSMYPAVMVHFNISPETVGPHTPDAKPIPDLDGIWISQAVQGLVPRTLQPLLARRIAIKHEIARLTPADCRVEQLKARAAALKWLLVVCFGYLGYKNARFGRIEAHEAVTAYGREALLRAKETAEDLGYRVLHMYVDGLWLQKDGVDRASAETLLNAITERTGLPIALEGIYRWVAFLPSRRDARVPVANRYFGVFNDGRTKVRGIEMRRGDTAPFVAQTQADLLALLTRVADNIGDDIGDDIGDGSGLETAVPAMLTLLQKRIELVSLGRVPLPQLLITQRLSRHPGTYKTPSPSARAAIQLAAIGKPRRPGQRIRFLYTRGDPGVWAWDLPMPPPPATALNIDRYTTLLIRAASALLDPLGFTEADIRAHLAPARQLPLPLTSSRTPPKNRPFA